MMRIPAELEKGHKDRLLAITPDSGEILIETPEDERTGYVFDPRPMKGGQRINSDRAMKIVAEIGSAARVKVLSDAAGKVKFASAHDLRRCFGERWAGKVLPQTLMELMRHESIETTKRDRTRNEPQKRRGNPIVASEVTLWATVG